MRNSPSATHSADPWDRICRLLGAAVWCLATMALAYVVVLATFVLGYIMTGGMRLPPAPPDLALPALPEGVRAVLILYGPCALAGGVVLARSRWWVGIVGGVGLGALSGTVLYLSVGLRPETPLFAPVGWVLAGYVGAVVGQFRRELRGGSAKAAHAAPPAAANAPAVPGSPGVTASSDSESRTTQ